MYEFKIGKNLTEFDSRCFVCRKQYAYITPRMKLGKYPVTTMDFHNWRYRFDHLELYRHIFQKNMKYATKRGRVNYVFGTCFVTDLHCSQNIIKE